MAIAHEFEKVALVCGILSTAEDRREELISELEKHFGPVLEVSSVLDFPYTDYYDGEMAGRPVRYLVMFRNLVDPSRLAEFKTISNAMEHRFAGESGRHVNIDPGLLSLSNFILATCKNRSHRIALRDGVYAEVTLIYENRDFQRLPWTYADYSDERIKAVLRGFRDKYKELLRGAGGPSSC